MKYIIGVDIGTSGTKAIAFANNGTVLYSSHVSYETISPHPGESEIEPQVLVDAAVKTIANVFKNAGSKKSCLGISFSCAMHSLIAVDKNAKPLTNVITWADL